MKVGLVGNKQYLYQVQKVLLKADPKPFQHIFIPSLIQIKPSVSYSFNLFLVTQFQAITKKNQEQRRNDIQFQSDRQRTITRDMQDMNNRQESESNRMREQIELIENDRAMYVQQKQWLFKQLGADITFLLDHLAGNEQQFDDGKQQQDTAIETYIEKNYFIQKLHEKEHQIEMLKWRIDAYERRERELEQAIESRERQLQELKTFKANGQQQQIGISQKQQQQHPPSQQNQSFLNKKLSQIQQQRDVKIQQLQLMQKHMQHMKLMYGRQNEELLKQRKVQMERVVREKDLVMAKANQKLQYERVKYELIQQQSAAHKQQLKQLNKNHRNELDVVSAKYEKQIIKLSSKYQYEIDQLKSGFDQQRKQSLLKCKELESKVRELEEVVKGYECERQNEEERRNKISNSFMEQKILQLTNQLKQQAKLLQQKCQQIQNYQQHHLNISNQLTQLKQQHSKLTTTNTFLQSKNIDLFSQLQKATRLHQQSSTITNKRLQYLQNQLQQNKTLISEYKKQITNSNSLIQELRNQLSQKDIKLQSLDRQLQRTKNYNQILLSDVKSLSSDVKTLNTKIHELDQSNMEIKKKSMLTSRRDLDNNKKKNVQVDSRILTKSSALECLTDRSNDNNSRIEQFNLHQQQQAADDNRNKQQQQQTNHQSMRIQRIDNNSKRNNSSLVLDRVVGRRDNSLMMQRSNNSMVMERNNRSPVSSRNCSPLSDNQFRTKYRINVTEQLKQRRAKREQQLKSQQLTPANINKQQQQQQLQHVYSMQTTFSPMPMPMPNNIKPNSRNNIINSQITAKQKQRQQRMNLFRKKNQRLVNYRERIRQQKDAITVKKMHQNKQGNNNNTVSEQFKTVLKAYDEKKNQLYDESSNKVTQNNILKKMESKQILIEDTQHDDSGVRDARNTHSSLQGEYEYEDLSLTFKPKIPLEQEDHSPSRIIDSARSKTFIQNNLLSYGKSDSLQSKSDAKDQNRYLSLNSSFEDQSSITQEDIKSNNLRPSTKERIMRQLPVHLFMSK